MLRPHTPKYLVRRDRVYYLRIAVPTFLRARFGCHEFKASLQTKDDQRGRIYCRVLSNQFEHLFSKAIKMPELTQDHTPDTIKGSRDRALLLLGFCGALRRSELVAVRVEDLEFTSQGIVLTLPRSKTDQLCRGRKIGIPRGRSGRSCPVMAVNEWIVKLGAACGPVFRAVSKGGSISNQNLSSRAVADVIKYYAHKAGLPPERYSGHSLRSGLATSAAQHGISSWKIRQQTGHKSDSMLARYIRDGDIFMDNAAALF